MTKLFLKFKVFKINPLKYTYAVVFVDGIHFKIREGRIFKEVLVYIPLGIDLDGKKRVLSNWLSI